MDELRPKLQWGASLWAFIHTITVVDSTDPHTVERMSLPCMANLRALTDSIPCHRCADTYRAHLALLPDPGSGPLKAMALFEWGWKVHNAVNAKLGRPEMTYEDAVAAWAFSLGGC